ncbi:MAG: hypothetical protein JKY01_10855 [Pseudomonadales bacterium]|nr:hypothetical protein [Pseudomonadales bacterium]
MSDTRTFQERRDVIKFEQQLGEIIDQHEHFSVPWEILVQPPFEHYFVAVNGVEPLLSYHSTLGFQLSANDMTLPHCACFDVHILSMKWAERVQNTASNICEIRFES